jgi:hypothetical protein
MNELRPARRAQPAEPEPEPADPVVARLDEVMAALHDLGQEVRLLQGQVDDLLKAAADAPVVQAAVVRAARRTARRSPAFLHENALYDAFVTESESGGEEPAELVAGGEDEAGDAG